MLVEESYDVAEAEKYLAEVAEHRWAPLSDRECRQSVEIEPHAPDGLVDHSTSDSLIVIATSAKVLPHGHYIGSCAEAVVRRRPHPVLAVGPNCTWDCPVEIDRVVVPVDGSTLSEQAVSTAVGYASLLDSPMWVVTVIDPHDRSVTSLSQAEVNSAETGYVRSIATSHDAGPHSQWEVLHGSPPSALANFAGQSTLTVMTSHGRSGPARLILGSVTTNFVKVASGPVLIERGTPTGDQ